MPGTEAVRLYLDSCVLIYRIERREPWATLVNQRLALLESSGAVMVVSELTRLECRTLPIAQHRADMLQDYDRFFTQPALDWQALDRTVFDLATGLRATHRLRTPDALHLAAAIQARCTQFWTNDMRLASAAAGHLEVRSLND